MCHHLTNTNDQMKPEGCNPATSSGGKLVGSQTSLEVNTRGNEDVSSPMEPLLGSSPTASLTSSNSFASTCSDLSVDLNFDGRNNQFYRRSTSDPEHLRDRQNRHLKKSSSVTSVNDLEKSDGSFSNNQVGADGNPEVTGNPEDSADACPDDETGTPTFDDPTDAGIWVPPPAENDDSLATFVVDDDDEEEEECADGIKWGKPSSLSSFEEDVSRSFQFKEEKEKAMEEVKNGKFRNLVSQLLKTVGIVELEKEGESWVDIVSSLAWAAALFVKPDAIKGKAMDPAGYVKVKCVETGSRSESQLVKGLVFKKHAAHKHMPTKYTKPRLILIRGILGHSSGLSSFNSMITQDKDNVAEDVKSLLEQLEACRPNVVLLEKSAPRDVLEEILKMGVTLVVDMKLHRLERIAGCTGSPICSADKLSQQLKQCDLLYFEKFVEEHAQLGEGGKKPHKTLMFLEGSPTRLGCTILLKGSHSEELKKIKCVVQCAVVMAYHYILETSFLIDQEVMFSTIVSDGGTINSSEEIEAASADRTNLPLSNGFHEQHAVKSTVLSSEKNSFAGTDSLSFAHEKDVSLESFLANGTDIPISAQEESIIACTSHGRDVPNGLHVVESHKLSSKSEYNAVVQDVMGTLVSPADQYMQPFLRDQYMRPFLRDQYMQPFLRDHERDPDAQDANPDSVLSATEASGHCGTEPNGHSNDDKLIDTDNNSQPLPSTAETTSDSQKTGSDSDEYIGRKDDISAVLDSASILVLMSRRNASRGTVCEQSHFSQIKFYRNFDVPLGEFLRDNVLNQNVSCGACGELPEAHYYYYAHHNKQLTIRVKRIDGEPLPGEFDKKLWMWSRCGKCKPEKEGNKNTTKRVLISSAARGLSFGKFLELSFSNHSAFNRLSNCGHSLHRDFLYFFGLGSMVSMFRYSPVVKHTVSVPPQELEFNSPIKEDWLQKETENVYTRAMLFFTEVSGYLKKTETRFSGLTMNINGSVNEFTDIEKMLAVEKFEFEENIKNTLVKSGHSALKLLCLNRLRWELFLEACIWNRRLQLLLSSVSRSGYTAAISKAVEDKSSDEISKATSPAPVAGASVVSDDNGHNASENSTYVEVQIDHIPGLGESSAEENAAYASSIVGDNTSKPTMENPALSSSLYAKDPAEPLMELLSSNGSSHTGNTPISDQAAIQQVFKLESCRGQHVWNPFSEIREECMKDIHSKVQLPSFLDSLRFDPLHSPDCLPTVSQIISEEGSRVRIPLSDDYIVSDYESEISSIIACAAAFMEGMPQQAQNLIKEDNDSHSGEESTDESVSIPRATSEPYPLSSSSSNLSETDVLHSAPSMSSLESRFSSFDGLNLLASLTSLLSLGTVHPEIHLGKAKYSVVCLFANEFRVLRNQCCPSELDYIASLSRCKIWDAKGGKSKSFFAKTLDDRLIIKEIKRTELESFVKFATEYFRYMNQSFESGNQTCLAKILGIYQVTIRQSKTGKETKHALMVMENLSFSRNVSRQYDLKGALHARYTANADGSEDVLLDQNFVNDMNLSPLYLGQKAKRLLQRAVWNDTTFLHSINVMDYSLLVGVDLKRRELMCGIIDYLRQYTWDKQLETWVKSSLVVPRNLLPTIISPKEYKKRFRKFMDTHFLTVPDLWCSQRSANPCKLCGIGGDQPSSEPKPKKQEQLSNVSDAS